MKKTISLVLLLSIMVCLITFTGPNVSATEIENYGIDMEDIYTPDLPTDLEILIVLFSKSISFQCNARVSPFRKPQYNDNENLNI